MHTSMQTEGVPRVTSAAGLAPGEVVGRWRIEGELGRGGMSTVYAAVHVEIGKRAALKLVHGHVLTGTFTAERVLLEAQVVNRIAHDHIVDIFESGTLPDGRPYLVMERLDGATLGHRFAAGRMAPVDVIGILLQICDALAAAHATGIVHRDLKLDNVFLVDGPDGPCTKAKVLDWGIAKIVTESPRNTFADKLIGTPQYVSPEQARGGEVTPAADIYSLGVMAYELFLEGPPFVSSSAAELLVMHLRDQPPRPSEVWPAIPSALEKLLLAMLAKIPEIRPTAVQVATELRAIRRELRGPSAEIPVLDAPAMHEPLLELAPTRAAGLDEVRELAPMMTEAPPIAPCALMSSSMSREVRRPRLQRQRVLVGALAAATLLAGAGAMEALLSRDSELEADIAEAAPDVAPRGGPTENAAPTAPTVIAAEPIAKPDLIPAAAPVAARQPEPKARKARRPRPEARSARHDLAAELDPDGTIEPYK
jgi:serine/threonine-protein kinase